MAWHGIAFALAFAVAIGVSSGVFRTNSAERLPVMGINFGIDAVVLGLFDALMFHFARPMETLVGLWPMIFVNLIFAAVVASAVDFAVKDGDLVDRAKVWRKATRRDYSPVDWVAWVLVLAVSVTWIVGYNGGHSTYRATHIVDVTKEASDALPPSSTTNMVIVPEGIAKTRATAAMNSGEARIKNYSTYLELPDHPTLEYVAGHMMYVFQPRFDGIGNKGRLHGVEPGYLMVPAEDINGNIVENYDGPYSMVVSIGGGQGIEPDRWAYAHGYSGYLLDDPTLEIDDAGHPYFTVTLLRPQLGWTFYAPVGMLLIDAHTGKITQYGLDNIPSFVDRVYSAQMAEQITTWWGNYSQAGFGGAGSSNANRYHVSGDPLLVYTGNEHPSWRMLLTSYNSDASVAYIVIMDAHSGSMHIYTPQGAMGTEPLVYDAFNSASGQGAGVVKANHYHAVALTIHVIYNHVTFMVTYETEGDKPSFAGVGFLDAYHAIAANAVFGSTREQALNNYLIQLGVEQHANGNNPSAGAQNQMVTGVIADINWDLPVGGPKLWYIMLAGDNQHVYVGPATISPAVVMAKAGDHVTVGYLSISPTDSTRTMQSFSDADTPLRPLGS